MIPEMTSVNIKFYMGIESITGSGHETFSFQGNTLGELVSQLIGRYPSLKTCFEERDGLEPAPGISILVNSREIMWLEKMATRLSGGDEIVFLRFVSGG
ncbi:MAG: MoaD family protein [Thermodesulfobacteriota bacterium]|nr:MoaD family protein [Thermodesulfobacteriota bacterium]